MNDADLVAAVVKRRNDKNFMRLLQAIVGREASVLARLDTKDCVICHGIGVVDGFWLFTDKTCPTCHGSGKQPR